MRVNIILLNCHQILRNHTKLMAVHFYILEDIQMMGSNCAEFCEFIYVARQRKNLNELIKKVRKKLGVMEGQ